MISERKIIKEPARGGCEQDVTTGWKKILCWCERAKASAFWKKRIRRRLRRRLKEALSSGSDDEASLDQRS